MTQVYLDGIEIDVLSQDVKQTLQANNIAEIQSRQVSITNSFNIPFTPKNVQFFDYLSLIGNTSDKPYSDLRGKIVVDGVEFAEGKARVTATKDSKYNVQIKSETADLFEDLKGLTLKDIDYSTLNHYLNLAQFESFINSNLKYTYAISDNGQSLTSPLDVCGQVPLLYVQYIWQKIFNESGYTFSGDIFDTASFQTELHSMSEGFVPCGLAHQEGGGGVINNEFDPDDTWITLFQVELDQNINNNAISQEFDGVRYNWIVKKKCKFSISLRADISDSYLVGGVFQTNGATEGEMRLYKNDVLDETILWSSTVGVTTEEIQFDFFKFGDVDDRYSLEFTATIKDSVLQPVSNDQINFAVTFPFVKYIVLEPYIDFSELVEDISQIDFIKDIMRRYLLIFKKNAFTNEYEFKMMEDLLNERDEADDWSDKYSETLNESYNWGQYGIENRFEYKYPQGLNNIFDATHVSSNVNYPADKVLISSIYTMSAEGGNYLGEQVYNPRFWESNDDGTFEIQSINTRLFKRSVINDSISLIDGNGATSTYVGDIHFCTLENVNMAYYRDEFYPAFLRIVDEPLRLDVRVDLTPSDIKNNDFFKLVYLEQTGQYYYRNLIRNFVSPKLTAVELIQAVGFTSELERRCNQVNREFNPVVSIVE